MAQRLNKNLVVGLTVAGMVISTGIIVVLIMLLPAPDPGPFLKQAQGFEKEGKYEEAMKAYSGAAGRARQAKADSQHFKQANSYYILAGDMALKAGKVREALELWNVVTRDDRKNQTAQERILGVYLDIYRLVGAADWPMVEQEARKLCDMDKANPNPRGQGALGLALIKQRGSKAQNVAEGEALLKKAVERKKDDPELADYLAGYYLEDARSLLGGQRPQDNYQQAEAQLRQAEGVYDQLKANMGNDPQVAAVAWRYRGMFYLELRNLNWVRLEMLRRGAGVGGSELDLLKQLDDADKKALESLELATKAAPDDEKNLWAMGNYWVYKPPAEKDETKKKAETDGYRLKAKTAYEQAIAKAPDEFEGYLRLAMLHRQSGNLAAASEVLGERLKRGIQRGTRLEFRNVLYMTKLREEAFDVRIAQAAAVNIDAKEKDSLLADLEKLRNEYANDAQGGQQNPIAKFMLGRILMLNGKFADALKVVEEANAATAGNDALIKLSLARLYDLNHVPAKAEELLLDVTQHGAADRDGPWALLAAVQMELGKPDEALLSAQRATQLNPRNRDAWLAMAKSYEAKGNTPARDDILRNKLGIQENLAAKYIQEAIELVRTAQPGELPDPANIEKAKTKLHDALKIDPTNYAALRNLAIIQAPRKDESEEAKTRKATELKADLDAALAALNKKMAEAPATQPAAGGEDLKRLAANIRLLEIYAKPSGSQEQRIADLEQIILQDPDPFERARGLASLYSSAGQNAKAVEQLQKASSLRPKDTALLEDMFTLALGQKETWPVAEDCIKKLIEAGAAPTGGRMHRGRLAIAKAQIARQENNDKESKIQAGVARDEFEASLKEFSTNPDACAGLGQALAVLGEVDKAQQALGKALEMNPRHVPAILLMYDLARSRNDENRQNTYLRRLQEVRPDHPLVRQRMQELEEQRDPKAGIARREKADQENPKDADNLMALANLYARAGQFDKARAAYDRCRALLPDNLLVIGRYAMFLREKDPPEPAAAEQMLKRAMDDLKNDTLKSAQVQLLLAGHYQELNRKGGPGAPSLDDVAQAYEMAARVRETPEILMDIGQFYVTARRFGEAEGKFRRAIEISNGPESREINRKARQIMIQLLMASPNDRYAEIEREIAAYGQKFEDGFAQVAHFDLAMAAGRTADALDDINAYIAKMPQEPLGFYYRGRIQYQRGAIDRAIEDLRKAESLDPHGLNFEHRRLLAQCLVEAKQPDMAIAQLNSIVQDDAGAAAAVKQLVSLYVSLAQWTKAEALLSPRAHDTNDPNRMGWANLLVALYVRQNDTEKALQAAREAAEAGKYDPSLISMLADLCASGNRPQDLIQFVTQKVPAEQRKPILVQLRLAEAYAAAKEMPKALEIYEKLLADSGGQLDVAQSIAVSINRAVGKDGMDAVKKWLAARPVDRASKFVTAIVQIRAGEFDAGMQTINALLTDTTGTDDRAKADKITLLRMAGELYHGHGDLANARKLYEQLLEIAPNDYEVRNNLAYLLMTDVKDLPKALENAELAVRGLPPDMAPQQRAAILDTLGWSLILNGKFDTGVARMRQAINLAQSGTEAFDYVLAGMCYHAAEGFARRSEGQTGRNAQSDREEAALACRRAWRLLKTGGSADPEHLSQMVRDLAAKLKIGLEEPSPATQTAPSA